MDIEIKEAFLDTLFRFQKRQATFHCSRIILAQFGLIRRIP
jgi:hypothetical protein